MSIHERAVPAQPDRQHTVLLTTSVLTDGGRVSGTRIFRELGWAVGDGVRFTVGRHIIALQPAGTRPHHAVIRRPGHVHLPAGVRISAGMAPDDSVLLLAVPGAHLVAIVSAQLAYEALHPAIPDAQQPL
ncbi:hypothetical protein [Nocardia sp. NPDC057353]|uniref:hypothetical protein n=1 Tax=Nocardia sp. NPDC057353 TaxID=3346104 RepID=UPI00362C2247